MGTVTIKPISRGEYLQEVIALCKNYQFASAHLIEGIINCKWQHNSAADDVVGYVLLDDDTLCGFAGCMKSTRIIGGRELTVNAGSSAVVKDEYRSYSIKLFQKLFTDGDLILDLTPTDETYRFLMTPFFKCKQLDTAAIAYSRFRLLFQKHLKATAKTDEILNCADGAQRTLIEDNLGYAAKGCTVYLDGEPLTLICRVFTKAKIVRIADILYIDKPALFAKRPEAVMAALCRKLHTLFCWCDSRWLPAVRLPETLTERENLFKHPLSVLFGKYTAIRRNSIYRIVSAQASEVTPLDLDALYSEKIMM